MPKQNVLVVGAGSDLIQPLLDEADSYGLSVLKLNRSNWNLDDCTPPPSLISQIISFSPSHVLYAAGLNCPQDLRQDPVQTLKAVNEHLMVNCLSFISIVLHLQSRLAAPLISIHALSSLYGLYGRRTRLPYSVSKHALEGAVKCLAIEYPETLVLAYRPGFFKTKLTDKNINADMQDRLKACIPAGRLGSSSELSAVILRNILDPPLYASGSAITLDGGLTAGGIFEL